MAQKSFFWGYTLQTSHRACNLELCTPSRHRGITIETALLYSWTTEQTDKIVEGINDSERITETAAGISNV